MKNNTYKKKLTLSIDRCLVNLAKESKINISAFLEDKLKEYFIDKWARPDLNRRPLPRKGSVITPRPLALATIRFFIFKFCE